MASRTLLRHLMTGAAVASLSTNALADGWDGLIVFGGRDYDSGQYVSYEAVFADEDDDIGDGRQRATNLDSDGGRALVVTQRVSNALGFDTLNPSQPQSYADVPTPEDGWNYSALFFSSEDILNSITGTTTTNGIRFQDDDGTEVTVAGRTRLGLLNDPDRAEDVWGAMVLVGSAQLDLRETANVVVDLDGEVDLDDTSFTLDSTDLSDLATAAAANIVTGVEALTDADAGLVVVSNAYDAGAMPEVSGDNDLLSDADTALEERETEASDADDEATAAEAAGDSDAATLRATADALALTDHEIALRTAIDAALADSDLIGDTRSSATDTYNAYLLAQLRANGGNVVLIDQHALFEAVIEDPARFGLSDDYDQAEECVSSTTLYPCTEGGGTVDDMLFVDGLNLTETAHQLVADQIVALVSAPEAIGGIPGTGISSGRGIADTVRDQVSREQTWKASIAPFFSGIGTNASRDGDNGVPNHQTGLYGGVAGVKYIPRPGFAIGVAGGYQHIISSGSSAVDYDGDALTGTVFAGINTGPVFGSVTASYGKVYYDDVTRSSDIGDATFRNSSDTEGRVLGFTGEAGLRLVAYDILRAGPIANISHWRSKVDGYSENGWAVTAVRTDDLERTSTRAGIGAFMEAGSIVDGEGSVFRVKALYGYEFDDGDDTVTVTPLGDTSVGSFSTQVQGEQSAPLELGAEVVLGYRGLLTTFGYDGLFGDVDDHRFRVGASMPL